MEAEVIELARRVLRDVRIETVIDSPSFATRDLASFEPLLGACVREPIDLPFFTEAAVVAQAGIDAVVWGPGLITHAHAPDEWVAIDELEAARATFAKLLAGS